MRPHGCAGVGRAARAVLGDVRTGQRFSTRQQPSRAEVTGVKEPPTGRRRNVGGAVWASREASSTVSRHTQVVDGTCMLREGPELPDSAGIFPAGRRPVESTPMKQPP